MRDSNAESARTRLGPGPHFGVGAAIFGSLKPEDIALTARLGFPGIEPYRSQSRRWLDRPRALKELLDHHDLTMITCSNGGDGQSCDFIDPAARARTIADHVAFARDFLSVFGCAHFKMNMGARPAGGTSAADLQAIADTLNELGRLTLDLGIKLAPHPHIWGPIERPQEIDGLMELTDPRYVYLCPDTAHINLGGGDPVGVFAKHYDRIVAVHWKDSKASYRGYTGPTPTREQHEREILYKDLGAGGVDHPTIWRMLQERGYAGWITLDLDPPRPAEGEGTIEEKILVNRGYLFDELGVASL